MGHHAGIQPSTLNEAGEKIRSSWLATLVFTTALLMSLAACNPAKAISTPRPSATAYIESEASVHPSNPPDTPVPDPTRLPRTYVLKVPSVWAEVGVQAIAQVNSLTDQRTWQLDVGEPSRYDLDAGWADAILVQDQEGIFAGQHAIALAVPFTSIWDGVTLQQAESILADGSEFIQVMDWAEMQPTLKSVLIEGLHPSETGYPLQQSWSLHATAEAEQAMGPLALALRAGIEHDPVIKLAAVGDLMLARTIGEVLERGNIAYPFEHIAGRLQEADVAIGNLESALGTGGRAEDKGYTFQAPPEAAAALSLAGFDVLSLANNHAMDYGPQLLVEAINTLADQGIAAIGAGGSDSAAYEAYILELNGLSVAFLAFVDVPQEFRGFDTRTWQASKTRPGIAWADPQRMQVEIERARQASDLVVVLLHSGFEYVPRPSPPQVNAARIAIEAGADLVLGHHAHLLQPVEFHSRGVIVYGLGNFVFEDAGPPESALVNVWLDDEGVRELQFIPVGLDSEGRPMPVEDDLALDILANLNSYTDAWRSQTPVLDP